MSKTDTKGHWRQYRQSRWPITVASLLLFTILGLLLIANYQNQKRIFDQFLYQNHLDITNKSRILQFYIKERGNNLHELADGAVISGYFINQSLGMSEAYGLRASRNQVVRHFTSLNNAISSEGQSVFDRLCLYTKDGTLIAEMNNAQRELQPLEVSRLSPDVDIDGRRLKVIIDPSNPDYLLIFAAVENASGTAGYVAGWLSLYNLFSELIFDSTYTDEGKTGNAVMIVLSTGDQRFVYPRQLSPAAVNALTDYLDQNQAETGSNKEIWTDEAKDRWLEYPTSDEIFIIFPLIKLDHDLTLRGFVPQTYLLTDRSTLFSSASLALLSILVLILFFTAFSFRKKAELNAAQSHHLSRNKVVTEEMNKALNREISQRQKTQRSLAREKALLQAERERFNLVITATKIGLWDWQIDSNELTVNERWAEMVGYQSDELHPFTLETWIDLLHPEDCQQAMSRLNQHLQGEIDYYSCELRMRHKRGHWIWVHDQGQVVNWAENGKAKRMTGTHADISERKAIEQRLKENEQNFRSFFESIIDMIFVISPAGNIIFANQTAYSKLGFPDGELVGTPVLDLHPLAIRDEAERVFQDMLNGRQRNCPLALQAKDAVIPVDTRVWHGKWNGNEVLFGISKDLSEEVEAKQKFDRVFRNNPALMSLSTVESHTIVDVNESFLTTLGFSRQEVVGRTFAELSLFVDPDGATRILDCDRETDRLDNRKLQIRCRTGALLDGLFSSERITSQGETLVLMVMINITDLENTKRQLRLVNETLDQRVKKRTRELEELHARMLVQDKMASLGQLAAGVAHELNNPINFVTTNFSALKDYFADLSEMIAVYREHVTGQANELVADREEEFRIDYILDDIPDLFNESERGFERIAKIIRNMREFAHTDLTGQFVLFDLNDGIEETLTIARNTYKYCAEVRTSYGDIPKLCCIPDLLKQVFLNLVVNSAQAIEAENRSEHGMIEITTNRQGDHLLCTFADDGPGIPEEIRYRVFDPFFTTKPPGKGTGLGLSLCYEIVVKKHHGELSVSSPSTGGTVFTIRLPISEDAVGSPCQAGGP